MTFLSHWQPLRDEDAHTALVFGFLRHAPAEAALNVWLAATLGRPVSAGILERSSFWPGYDSIVAGSQFTVPELVFAADDGRPMLVLVEVKPGFEMHTVQQLEREVIDVSNAIPASRIACVMVGADLGRPAGTATWEEAIASAVRSHLQRPISVELRYSSFADIAHAIVACGRAHSDWSRYASDVVAQLQQKALLGYEGAPMFDDLEGLSVPNAVELFNRAILTARQFYLQLHGQSVFVDLQFRPPPGWNYRMVRDGRSQTVTQDPSWFTTTVLLSEYEHATLAPGTRAFVAFDLLGSGGHNGDLLAGCARATKLDDLGVETFTLAIRNSELAADSPWSERAALRTAEWFFDRRPWQPGQPVEDVAWAVSELGRVVESAKSVALSSQSPPMDPAEPTPSTT